MQEMLRQLHAVGALQRHLLPRQIPQLPGWRLAVHYAVGHWPGGDYYDFLPLPDGRLMVLVADASDQGAPSSVLVAMVRVVLHSCPLSSGVERLPFCPLRETVQQPPHILLSHLNQVLVENSLEEQFLTAFCGALDPIDGNFRYSNAGHPAPLWWHARTRVVEPVRDATGLPLGIDRQASYHQKRIVLEPGDVLLLYSDGLTTASNARAQVFGCERLGEALRESAPRGAEAVKSAVLAGLADFVDGASLYDDVTLLVLSRDS
jgi:sigma-B regulation protein RsbU (phosphoserine phosphatase)